MADDHPIIKQCSLSGSLSTENDLLQCIIENLSETDEHLAEALNFVFLLFSTTLVFFMQAGFAMLCAGSVRKKNVQNTMLKNLLDACGAAIGFWIFGYAFAYSPSKDGSTSFIGRQNFLLMGLDIEEYGFWLFQFAFAATSVTIVAGTLAERCQMIAYLCYSLVLAGFAYPVVVRAVWSDYGFLSRSNGVLFGDGSETGVIDFAGSGVVHITGGFTALLATLFLGPRRGRFYDFRGNKLNKPSPMPGHSAALQVLGTFILWLGWYGFNCGSIIQITSAPSTGINNALISSLAAVNTTLAASGGSVTALFTKLILTERRTGEATFDLLTALNGTLAGLVAITAGCAVVDPWAALFIGVVSGWIYLLTSSILVRKCIDDAVDAIPVHLANGIWGCIAVGLFARPSHLFNLYGSNQNAGCFYEFGQGRANFTLLGAQLVGILFILGWILVIMSPFFCTLDFLGWFRADTLEEMVGLDVSYHGNEGTIQTEDESFYLSYIEAKKARMERKENMTARSDDAYSLEATHAAPLEYATSNYPKHSIPKRDDNWESNPISSNQRTMNTHIPKGLRGETDKRDENMDDLERDRDTSIPKAIVVS